MITRLLQKAAHATLIAALVTVGVTPALALAAWSAPLVGPPGCTTGNPGCDAPINVSSVPQSKAGALNLYNTLSPGSPLSVGGEAGGWSGIFNWPIASAPSGSYGILVGSSASGYSEFENASGYYAELADGDYGLYTNGYISSAGYTYGPNSFGGTYVLNNSNGGCQFGNPWSGLSPAVCSCPGFAPNAYNFMDALYPTTNYIMVGYMCY